VDGCLRQASVVPSEQQHLYEKRSRGTVNDGQTYAHRRRNRRGLREGVDILSAYEDWSFCLPMYSCRGDERLTDYSHHPEAIVHLASEVQPFILGHSKSL
jgi:hypothetical protein